MQYNYSTQSVIPNNEKATKQVVLYLQSLQTANNDLHSFGSPLIYTSFYTPIEHNYSYLDLFPFHQAH